MADLINEFASSSYSQLLSASKNENLFFSPASIFVALSMTYCGTRNKTAEQMRQVLKLKGEPNDEHLHTSLTKLWEDITSDSTKDAVSLDIANRLWLEQSYQVKDEFQNQLSSYYKADAKTMNFKGDSEASRVSINNWVAEQTNQKILDLIPSGSINPLTRLVITNAIYFKGKWVSPFKSKMTKSMPFFTAKDISKDVSMMFQKGKYGYIEHDELKCKALTMSYTGCNIRMTIVVPNEIEELPGLETNIFKTDDFNAKFQSLVSKRKIDVQVFIPKFKFSQSCSLKDMLKNLGITELFSEQTADLSGISKINDLYVSEVVHKAFVDVNEDGTEAAAATAVIMKNRCMPRPVPVFKADHPFVFFIHDEKTKTILFMGRVNEL